MTIEDQIEFIDDASQYATNEREKECWAAVRESLKKLEDRSQQPEEPTAGNSRKSKITLVRYQEFVGVYNEFCKRNLGAPAQMDAYQGKCLKETVAYLMKQEKVNHDEDLALEGWQYIFKNWGLLSEFIQRQTKLSDLKKNIQEILFQLRNVSKEAKKRKSASDWDQFDQLTGSGQ